MRSSSPEAEWKHPSRAGFSIIEAVMVLLIVLVVIGTLTPSVMRQITHSRINRAAGAVAADFYLAQSLASSARAPVRIVFSATAKTAFIRRGSPDTVLQRRYYGTDGEFKLPSFSATPDSILVLVNGMTSGSITVSLSDGTYTRQVRMSRAGQIRILRN